MRRKYHNIKTNGYDSRHESAVADRLRFELLPGDVLLEQVPIKFACGAKLVIDFAIERNGKVHRYVEAKGLETAVYRLKVRLLKHERPDVFERLEVVKSEGALKREARVKRKSKAARDAKKAGAK